MVGGEWYLAGADEVHVIGLDPVDVLGCLTEESGALHRRWQDQGGRDHRDEAVLRRLLHREVEQSELQLRAHALEVEESRARHLRAAAGIDGVE